MQRSANFPRLLVAVLVCSGWAATLSAQAGKSPAETDAVKQVLATQAAAWNRGDIEGFMDGYAKLPDLRFASGGTVTYGWQETLDRYKQHYPDRAAMGTLTFSDLDVNVLAPDTTLAFGRWRLHTSKGELDGLFTLLMRRMDDQWRIVADHTSAAEH